ncbi:MAG TPA: hypothetical protein VLR26_15325 [Frankiaceae bacterium]|nr:hypothetical protein [Frankiaceae bacterium]
MTAADEYVDDRVGHGRCRPRRTFRDPDLAAGLDAIASRRDMPSEQKVRMAALVPHFARQGFVACPPGRAKAHA